MEKKKFKKNTHKSEQMSEFLSKQSESHRAHKTSSSEVLVRAHSYKLEELKHNKTTTKLKLMSTNTVCLASPAAATSPMGGFLPFW